MRKLSEELSATGSLDEPKHYRNAVSALRAAAEFGFADDEPEGSTRGVCLRIGINQEQTARLLLIAMHEVDPQSEVFYDPPTGDLRLEFDASFEKPPIRQVRSKLESVVNRILACCTQDSHGYYVIRNPEDWDLDVGSFMAEYATEEYPATAYFRMPKYAEPFTDSRGDSFQPGQLVHYYAWLEYYDAHPELQQELSKLNPTLVMIDDSAMQKALDALGVSEQKKGWAVN